MQIPNENMDLDIVREVEDSWIFDWQTDTREGLHCSACGSTDNYQLLNNPKLPRILCIRCFSLIVTKYAEVDSNGR